MPTTKNRFWIYLNDEDRQKLYELQAMMDADSVTETVRRMIRKEYKEQIEQKQKEKRKNI